MNLRAQLASPSAMSLWVPIIPGSIWGISVVLSTEGDTTSAEWILAATAATAASCLVFLAARPLVRRVPDERTRVGAVLIAFALTGAAHSVSSGSVIGIFDPELEPSPMRVALRAVIALLWLPLAAVAIVETRGHRAAMRTLTNRVGQLRAAEEIERERFKDVIQAVRDEAIAPLLAALERFRAALEPAAEDGTGPESALRMGRLIDQQVRALSHRLLGEEKPWSIPGVQTESLSATERIRVVLETMTARPSLHPAFTVLLYEGTMGAFIISTGRPIELALANFVAGSAILAGVAIAANRLLGPALTRTPVAVRLATSIAVAAISVMVGMVAYAGLAAALTGAAEWGWAALITFPLVVLLIGFAAGVAAERRREEEHLDAISRRLATANARIAQRVRYERRVLGAWLHGPTQSALLAVVRRVEKADPADLPRVVDEVVPDLVTVIESVHRLGSGVEAAPVVLDDAIRSMIRMWRGALDVSVEIDADARTRLEEDPSALDVTIDVIAEALGNASRHGAARTVAVTVVAPTDVITVSVADDGHLGPDPVPGMGSRLLDEVTIGWSLAAAPEGGTELRADIPCRAATLTPVA